MIERTPWLNFFTHLVLLSGLVIVFLPMWLVFVGGSLTLREVNTPPVHLWPGGDLWNNLVEAWHRANLGDRLVTSLIMAFGVAAGKVVMAMLTAFGLVYFRFPGRSLAFWGIFITLMLPLEARIVPTYAVAVNALVPFQAIADASGISGLWQHVTGRPLLLEWNLLNSYTGLILPLVATATGTFLYRQFFMTIPNELLEAAKMDSVGPLRFFWDILVPLSRTNMMALFTIMFLDSWNQYLWPLMATPDRAGFGTTAVVALKILTPSAITNSGGTPDWHIAMAGCLIVMVPPLLVVIAMQRFFVRGLVATEK